MSAKEPQLLRVSLPRMNLSIECLEFRLATVMKDPRLSCYELWSRRNKQAKKCTREHTQEWYIVEVVLRLQITTLFLASLINSDIRKRESVQNHFHSRAATISSRSSTIASGEGIQDRG